MSFIYMQQRVFNLSLRLLKIQYIPVQCNCSLMQDISQFMGGIANFLTYHCVYLTWHLSWNFWIAWIFRVRGLGGRGHTRHPKVGWRANYQINYRNNWFNLIQINILLFNSIFMIYYLRINTSLWFLPMFWSHFAILFPLFDKIMHKYIYIGFIEYGGICLLNSQETITIL